MEPTQLSEAEFGQFQKLIFKLTGIQVPGNKVMLLSNRIRRRVKATGQANFHAYLKFLSSPQGESELEEFFDSVTTNETSFLRTEKHFEWLRTEFLDDLCARAQKGQHPKSLRLWSAACSSGEEPYTMAMCLAENRLRLLGWDINILGTDISEKSLVKARNGSYSQQSVESIPDDWRSRYFLPSPDETNWTVKPAIKAMVTIQRHNLTEALRDQKFDCIFIRNVLIYFSRESKQVVIDHLVKSLADGGYLVVGPSEGIYDMLGMLTKRATFLYQKGSAGGPHVR